MAFVNVSVETGELPRAADLELEPMAPAYYREVLIQQLITWSIVTVALLIPFLVVTKPEGLKSFLLLAPLLGLGLALVFIPLTGKQARVKAFALRQHDIIYRSGLWWRKSVVLAFNRIQHMEISIGPLQRRFGLASLKFYTAGGASVDLRLDGLTRERAEQLREFIMQRGGE
jgi:membrane protein YdbS with pleckstrin-like domain